MRIHVVHGEHVETHFRTSPEQPSPARVFPKFDLDKDVCNFSIKVDFVIKVDFCVLRLGISFARVSELE